jgi:hypothetical protein
MVAGLAASGGGGGHDVVGRREVGLAGPEADHVLPRGLEGLGPGVDGQSGRFLDGGNTA